MTDDEIVRVIAEAVCGIDPPETYHSEVRAGLAALRSAGFIITRTSSAQPEAQAGSDTSGRGDRELHRAYLRLRSIIPGAYDTPYAPTPEQVWDVTEKAARALIARLAAADAMAEALERLTRATGTPAQRLNWCREIMVSSLKAYHAACATDQEARINNSVQPTEDQFATDQRPDAEAGTREGDENA